MTKINPRGVSTKDNILEENVASLRESADVLETLDNGDYEHSLLVVDGEPVSSPIGKHFRHVLDSYTQFLKGVKEGLVDYSGRGREKNLERDRDAAVELARKFADQMEEGGLEERVVKMRDGVGTAQTSVKRELHYLLSHHVHHQDTMRNLMEFNNYKIPEKYKDTFGIAHSTRNYRNQSSS